jgi:hypothetical protein
MYSICRETHMPYIIYTIIYTSFVNHCIYTIYYKLYEPYFFKTYIIHFYIYNHINNNNSFIYTQYMFNIYIYMNFIHATVSHFVLSRMPKSTSSTSCVRWQLGAPRNSAENHHVDSF